MTETLLQTKLFVPPLRPNLVPRPQLIDKLNKGLRLGHKLTLISAPAGSGKTTLACSWIHQLEIPVAWLSLDEGDNQPVQFAYYFLAALQTANCGLSDSVIAMLRSAQPPPLETVLTLLINDLAKQSGQVLLVLDDYHVIHELKIHKAMAFLLDKLPPQLHLVVTSRSDPAFPLHRLRASGQMGGIYVDDLRFTKEEVASFFVETLGLNLLPDDIATL